jgi:uncharacterized membrane protein YecN with MAPEG domain
MTVDSKIHEAVETIMSSHSSTSTPFGLSEIYYWIIFEVILICAQCITQGYTTMDVRKELFTKEFFEKNFPELKGAKGYTGSNGGYPDMGSGQFSNKLPLDQWLKLNNTIRPHYNYIEGLAPIMLFILVSGLYYTRFTLVMGILYIVGRQLYYMGYRAKGPTGRGVGVLMLDLALISLLVTSILTTFHYGGGMNGLMNALKSIY